MTVVEPDTPAAFYTLTLNAGTYDLGIGRGGLGLDEDIAFYTRIARQSGDRVLELGCGTGRVTIPLAEAGLTVTGLDRSIRMLGELRTKAERLPNAVSARLTLVQGDMRSFELGSTFDAVVVAFRAFQMLLSPDDQRECLRRVREHLRPAGRLVIDTFDPRLDLCAPGVVTDRVEEGTDPETGHTVRIDVSHRANDPVRQVLTEIWRFTEIGPDGTVLRTEQEQLSMRWTYRWEMHHLLELEGFEVDAEYSDYAGSPPAYGLEPVWVAHRAGG